jgi:murein DD-endopeptidase MepM/ murein hydrolase activator NlpD
MVQTPSTSPGADISTLTPVSTSILNLVETAVPTASPSDYQAQAGDTLPALAKRFGVTPDQITSGQPISQNGLISPGQKLNIPDHSNSTADPTPVLPDSEVVDSPSASDFNLADYVTNEGGYLSHYTEAVGSERLTGTEIVQRVVDHNSINPRLLLSLLEFRTHWVTQANPADQNLTTPMGYNIPEDPGLYLELSLTAKLLNMGYYGWREGSLTTLEFTDGQTARLAPRLNAGSVALQYLFARLYPAGIWQGQLYGKTGLTTLYTEMFGGPSARAAAVGPLFPAGLQPPALELPFGPGESWAFTAGPHEDWNTGTPLGALDFAPITGETHCAVSTAWTRAAAPGMVISSSPGEVLQALDGPDGNLSGWVLLYLHMASAGRAPAGVHLNSGDPVGHPSCEGGETTGTHVHLARKYHGEWIGAGDPLPFVLSGWTANPGARPYEGTLVKGNQVVTAHPDGVKGSTISH